MSDGIAFHTPDYDGNAPLICRRIALPSFLWPLFNGAYEELIEESNWYQFGDMPIDDVVQAFINASDEMTEGCMIGSVVPFATENLPDGVLLCDGSDYLITDYPKLADSLHPDLINVPLGRFNVPDLRGRFVLGELADKSNTHPMNQMGDIPNGSGGVGYYVLRYGIVAG